MIIKNKNNERKRTINKQKKVVFSKMEIIVSRDENFIYRTVTEHGDIVYKDKITVWAYEKTADAFNETLGVKQEYKRNKKPTRNAIDREIRDAKNQADHIVLDIQSEITEGDLKDGIHGRVKRSETIKTITVIRNNKDKTYKRKDIIKKNWKL